MGATYPDLFSAIAVAAGLEYKAGDIVTALLAQEYGGPDPVQQVSSDITIQRLREIFQFNFQ